MDILVVDDSATIRQKLRRMFGELGHQVVAEASNGEAALSELGKRHFDLITLDVIMPVADGLTTLKAIRDSGRRVPVLMVTSSASLDTMMEARQLGAAAFLTKPFSVDSLSDAVRALLASAGGKS